MASYEPGACNIGARERRKRRLLGLASLIGGAAYVVAVVAVDWPPVALFASVLFFFLGALGVLQSRAQFCVGFAMTERYDFTGTADETGRVHDAAAVRSDRIAAARLLAKAGVLALLATVAVYATAVLV